MKKEIRSSIKPNASNSLKSTKVLPTKSQAPKIYKRTNIELAKKIPPLNKIEISKVVQKASTIPSNPPKPKPKKYEECPNCDLKFTVLKDLEEHFDSVHDNSEEDQPKKIHSPVKSFNFSSKKTFNQSSLNKSLPVDKSSTSKKTVQQQQYVNRREIQPPSSTIALSSKKATSIPSSLNKSLPLDKS